MKKLLSVLLVISLIVSACALVACGDEKGTEAQGSEAKTEAKTDANGEKQTEAKTEAKTEGNTEEKTEATTEAKTEGNSEQQTEQGSDDSEFLTFIESDGYASLYSISEYMYNNMQRTEREYLDSTYSPATFDYFGTTNWEILSSESIDITLNGGAVFPLTQWDAFISDEGIRHEEPDANNVLLVAKFDRNGDGTDEYYLLSPFFALAGCPEHGGWTDETVESMTWYDIEVGDHLLDFYVPVDFAWN